MDKKPASFQALIASKLERIDARIGEAESQIASLPQGDFPGQAQAAIPTSLRSSDAESTGQQQSRSHAVIIVIIMIAITTVSIIIIRMSGINQILKPHLR